MTEHVDNTSIAPKARIWVVTDSEAGQRIDNFLMKQLKGVPKTRIYKALRKGEVRVNGSRKKPPYQLALNDKVRIPPIRVAESSTPRIIPDRVIDEIEILYEDEYLLIVNKPSGLAVHGGSGIEYGLIEALRQSRQQADFLELVHRLDRETSGCLMIAKSRRSLLALQAQLGEERSMEKTYLALVKGAWDTGSRTIRSALRLSKESGQHKRMVVDRSGQKSISVISAQTHFEACTLVEIKLLTGRMHQARVHCASTGFPVAGDWLYGETEFNRRLKKVGLKRLFLHAVTLSLHHPHSGQPITVSAPLPTSLTEVLERI